MDQFSYTDAADQHYYTVHNVWRKYMAQAYYFAGSFLHQLCYRVIYFFYECFYYA